MNRRKAGLGLALFSLFLPIALAQQRQGELRIAVKDITNSAVESSLEIRSVGPAKKVFHTDAAGRLVLHNLDFADYRIVATARGFDAARSAGIPASRFVVAGRS